MAIIGPMPGETPIAMIPGGMLISNNSVPTVGGGTGAQFVGGGNNMNATPTSPGSIVIRNTSPGSSGSNVGALSLGDITGGIIGQLAKYAMTANQPGVTTVGGGYGNQIQAPFPSGIGGGSIKIF